MVKQIQERQRLIEDEGEDWNPICIFPEGTTTNGRGILPFKRGAFEGMRTVVPVVIKLPERYMMAAYSGLEFWPQLIQYMSSFCFYNLEIQVLPEFTPNEWMLNNHKDKGDKDWMIFAECVRLAMARQGGLYVSHRPIREMLAWEKFMKGHSNTITLDGKTFVYPDKDEEPTYESTIEV